MIRLLITGGAGFIGTNAMGWAISNLQNVINIDIAEPNDEAHLPYWRKIDIRDKTALRETLKEFKPTHILHLAAMTGMDISDLSYFDANTIGVENLIEVSLEIQSLKRIVFTSSLLVCRNGYIPQNNTDYCPPNLYGKSKVIGERLVRESKLHCEWVIVRPTSIWGPWFEHSYKEFFKTIDKNRYMHIGRDEFCKPACFVGNTVYVMTKLLFEEKTGINGNTYYIADYPWYSTRQWANTIQRTLGSKKIRTAPLWLLRIIAIFGDVIKIVTRNDFPLTSFRLKNMLTGGEYPIENTREICGGLPYDLNSSVYQTARWMYEKRLINHESKEL